MKIKKTVDINEWCRQRDIWFLKIDIEIPEAIQKEVQQVYDQGFFVPHRYGDGDGWHSTAIHGFVSEEKENTSMGWYHTMNPSAYNLDEDKIKWGWTEVAEIAPETKRWLEDFPHSRYRRVRFMLLKPKGYIEQHHDANDQRISEGRMRNISSAINISITNPKGAYLYRTDIDDFIPFEPLSAYWFDNGVEHKAWNDSEENRFHIILHGGFNKTRQELMKKSLVKQFGKDVLKEIE